MNIVRLLPTAVVVALAVAVSAAAGASGDAPTLAETSPGRFPDRSYVLTLPQKQKLTVAQVGVTENGEPVDKLSVLPASQAAGGAAVILAIDASNSMRGQPIVDAAAAARAFVAKTPGNVKIGVVTFNQDVEVVLSPTTDRAAINAALAGTPDLKEKTRLNDALDVSRLQLNAARAQTSSIVLLTDGNDIGSTNAEQAVVDRLGSDAYRVFAVGLESDQFDPAVMERIAEQTGGVYTAAATSDVLTPIFADLGFQLGNEYLVLYRSLEKPERPVNVVVKVKGYPPVTSEYTTPALATSSGGFQKSVLDRILQSPLSMVALVLGMLALVWYAVVTLWAARRGTLRRRMSEFVSMPAEDAARIRRTEMATILKDYDRSFRKRRVVRGFADDCELAGIETSPSTLALLAVVGGILLGLMMGVLVSPWWALVAFVPIIALRAFVTVRVERSRRAFADQLPDNLDVFAQSLRAGHSLVGALAVVSESCTEPSKSEFARVVSDEQLGVPLDDALIACVERMHNRDLDQVALVALIQRDAGGNSAEVIEQVAFNIRVRQELRRLARTLTAQGRMARWILTLLPVGMFVGLWLLNKEYLEPLWQTTFGVMGVVTALVMVITGSVIIGRIVDIKV